MRCANIIKSVKIFHVISNPGNQYLHLFLKLFQKTAPTLSSQNTYQPLQENESSEWNLSSAFSLCAHTPSIWQFIPDENSPRNMFHIQLSFQNEWFEAECIHYVPNRRLVFISFCFTFCHSFIQPNRHYLRNFSEAKIHFHHTFPSLLFLLQRMRISSYDEWELVENFQLLSSLFVPSFCHDEKCLSSTALNIFRIINFYLPGGNPFFYRVKKCADWKAQEIKTVKIFCDLILLANLFYHAKALWIRAKICN